MTTMRPEGGGLVISFERDDVLLFTLDPGNRWPASDLVKMEGDGTIELDSSGDLVEMWGIPGDVTDVEVRAFVDWAVRHGLLEDEELCSIGKCGMPARHTYPTGGALCDGHHGLLVTRPGIAAND